MEALYKHAKNFVAGKDALSPTLQGIYFTGESAIMCNEYMMLMIKNVPYPERIVEPKTGRELAGEYPDVSRIIPKTFEAEISFPQHLPEWQTCFEIGAKIVKDVTKLNCICLSFDGADLKLQARNTKRTMSMDCKLPIDAANGKTPVRMFLNAKYVLNTLAVFKDLADCSLKMKFAGNKVVFESDLAFVIISMINPIDAAKEYGYAKT